MKFKIKKEELRKIPEVKTDKIIYLNIITGDGKVKFSVFGNEISEQSIETEATIERDGFAIIVYNNFKNVVEAFVDGSEIECEFDGKFFIMNAKNIHIEIMSYTEIPR